jgi:hypothetical protein
MWNGYEKACAKAFKELREQEEASRRKWWDQARGELLRRERAQGRDTSVLKSLWRRERRAARKMTRRRLEAQLQAEDEGPLPEEARNYILETPRVLLLALSSLNQSNLLKVMVDLAPAFVVNALWDFHRLSFEKKPGGAQAMVQAGHLIERICDYVRERDELYKARSRKRGVDDPRIRTTAALRGRFKSDAPLVVALWPCVRFLVAYKNAPPGARFALRAELGSLTRLLASIHLPSDWNAESSLRAAATRKRVSERTEKGQSRDPLTLELEEVSAPMLLALATSGNSPSMTARGDLEKAVEGTMCRIAKMKFESSDKQAILSYVADIREKILRTYVPRGTPSRPLRYIAKSLKNRMLDAPVRVIGKDISEPGSQEAIGSEQTVIAASSHRKHRAKLRKAGAESPTTAEIVHSIECGRLRQMHRDPNSERLTAGQCAERLVACYALSLSAVRNYHRKAVANGEIVPRASRPGALGSNSVEDFKVLEQRIDDNFQKRDEPRLLLKKAFQRLDKRYKNVSEDAVRQELRRIWGTARDENDPDKRYDDAIKALQATDLNGVQLKAKLKALEKARLKAVEKPQSKALERWAQSNFSRK